MAAVSCPATRLMRRDLGEKHTLFHVVTILCVLNQFLIFLNLSHNIRIDIYSKRLYSDGYCVRPAAGLLADHPHVQLQHAGVGLLGARLVQHCQPQSLGLVVRPRASINTRNKYNTYDDKFSVRTVRVHNPRRYDRTAGR